MNSLRRTLALSTALVLAVTLAPVAVADIIVTIEGNEIETDGPWEVKGRQVLFTDGLGVLSALRVNEVDLEASREATERLKSPPPNWFDDEAPAPREKQAPVMTLTNDDIGQAAAGGSVDFSHVTETSEIRAVIEVHSIGYDVSASLNGQRISTFTGDMTSEMAQVYHVNHPMRAKLEKTYAERGEPAELREQFEHFSLLLGSNQIEIAYELEDEEAAQRFPLRISIKASHYPVPILEFQADEPGSGSLSTSFEVREEMPEGFTTRKML